MWGMALVPRGGLLCHVTVLPGIAHDSYWLPSASVGRPCDPGSHVPHAAEPCLPWSPAPFPCAHSPSHLSLIAHLCAGDRRSKPHGCSEARMQTSHGATSALRRSLWDREEISSPSFGGDDPNPHEGAGLSRG